jgi:hypothetical protein
MERGWARRLGVEIFIISIIGAALGLIGPFGTFAMPGGVRIAVWIAFILGGYACFRPMILLGETMSAVLHLPPWLGRALALLIASLPTTLLVALMFARFDLSAALQRHDLASLYLEVVLIGLIVNAVFELLFHKTKVQPPAPLESPDPPAPSATQPLQAERLPPGFGPVIALKSEDHYVRVFSEQRDILLLIRLRDAIAMLADGGGKQVHRSWWVARAGVLHVRRKGREAEITLVTGHSVPVSRDMMPELRRAGWLDAQ